jgi:hypothetical protein
MSTTGEPWPADSWTAIAPFGASIFCVFINPPMTLETRTVDGGVSRRKPEAQPYRCTMEAANCNMHKGLSRSGEPAIWPSRPLPPIALPFRRPFVYCTAQLDD